MQFITYISETVPARISKMIMPTRKTVLQPIYKLIALGSGRDIF